MREQTEHAENPEKYGDPDEHDGNHAGPVLQLDEPNPQGQFQKCEYEEDRSNDGSSRRKNCAPRPSRLRWAAPR